MLRNYENIPKQHFAPCKSQTPPQPETSVTLP